MNASILRILDANANRAREALRVIEDYARFHLDDQRLCAELKQLRHALAAAIGGHLAEAILHRDTPGDVGTTNKTSSELSRADLAAVVTAAGKRLGEALRTIEEYLKVLSPADAPNVESLRYGFYDLESRIARTLRLTDRFANVRLYVLITESACKRPWFDVAEQALAGGADCLQLREKSLESAEFLARARRLVTLCREHNVPLIINDRPDIAILSGADGVHVGQTDLPPIETRKIIGPRMLLGISTHTIEHAKQAVLDGADYIGVGPVFKSETKTRDFVAGLEYARAAASQIPIPSVAIAGITLENVDQVLETGVQAVAITAAIAGSNDPKAATREFKERLKKNVGQTFLSAQQQPSSDSPARPLLPTASEQPNVPPTPVDHEIHKFRRRLPHWHLEGATYFVTFRICAGEFTPAERTIILEHMREGDPQYYILYAAVVMPDHAHMVIKPAQGVDLSRIMKGTKGASARKVNATRDVRGQVWQDESWDRIIRSPEEFAEKIAYCLDNPRRKGLVKNPWDYPWFYCRKEGEE